jgi:hypothetical protein
LPYRPTEVGACANKSPPKKLQPGDFKETRFKCEDEAAVGNMQVADRDTHEFLVERILQLKMHTFGKDKIEINDQNRYKFKASTLFNLQPSHERKKYIK